MARINQKYAIYSLAAIVVLSLFIYPSFSATGKQVIMTPTQDTSCSNIYYPMDCEAGGCIWSEEIGCTDGSKYPTFPPEEQENVVFPPPDTQPPQMIPSTCVGLNFWKCITTEDCIWDWESMMCVQYRAQGGC